MVSADNGERKLAGRPNQFGGQLRPNRYGGRWIEWGLPFEQHECFGEMADGSDLERRNRWELCALPNSEPTFCTRQLRRAYPDWNSLDRAHDRRASSCRLRI